jgi:hypothetical protein
VNGSLSGDDTFEKSSPAANADVIYSPFNKLLQCCLLVQLKLRCRRTAFPFPPLPTWRPRASYLLSPEVVEPPGGGDEEK